MALRLTLAFLMLLAPVACEPTEEVCVPMTATDAVGRLTPRDEDGNAIWLNPEGQRLGSSCTRHDECAYNWCYKGSSITGDDDEKGFCSRRCTCGEDCADEGYFLDESDRPTTEPLFYCQRPSVSGGSTDTEKAFCVPRCEALGDCADYSADYTVCKAPTTGAPKKLCHFE